MYDSSANLRCASRGTGSNRNFLPIPTRSSQPLRSSISLVLITCVIKNLICFQDSSDLRTRRAIVLILSIPFLIIFRAFPGLFLSYIIPLGAGGCFSIPQLRKKPLPSSFPLHFFSPYNYLSTHRAWKSGWKRKYPQTAGVLSVPWGITSVYPFPEYAVGLDLLSASRPLTSLFTTHILITVLEGAPYDIHHLGRARLATATPTYMQKKHYWEAEHSQWDFLWKRS